MSIFRGQLAESVTFRAEFRGGMRADRTSKIRIYPLTDAADCGRMDAYEGALGCVWSCYYAYRYCEVV